MVGIAATVLKLLPAPLLGGRPALLVALAVEPVAARHAELGEPSLSRLDDASPLSSLGVRGNFGLAIGAYFHRLSKRVLGL